MNMDRFTITRYLERNEICGIGTDRVIENWAKLDKARRIRSFFLAVLFAEFTMVTAIKFPHCFSQWIVDLATICSTLGVITLIATLCYGAGYRNNLKEDLEYQKALTVIKPLKAAGQRFCKFFSRDLLQCTYWKEAVETIEHNLVNQAVIASATKKCVGLKEGAHEAGILIEGLNAAVELFPIADFNTIKARADKKLAGMDASTFKFLLKRKCTM